MQMQIQINYLDGDGKIIGTHVSDDEWTPAHVREWEQWLGDGAVDHPGATPGWEQYDIIAVNRPAAIGKLDF